MIDVEELKIKSMDEAFEWLGRIIAQNPGQTIAKEDKRQYFLANDYINTNLEELTIEQIEKLFDPQFHQGKEYLKIKTTRLKEKRMEHYISIGELYPNKLDLDGIKREKKDSLIYDYLKILYKKPNKNQFKYLLGAHEKIVGNSFYQDPDSVPQELIEIMMEKEPQLIFNKKYSQNISPEEALEFFKTVWDKKFNKEYGLSQEGALLKQVLHITASTYVLNEEILDICLDYIIDKLDKKVLEEEISEVSANLYAPIFSIEKFLQKINQNKPELIDRILRTTVAIEREVQYDEWGSPTGKNKSSKTNLAQSYFMSHEYYYDLDFEEPKPAALTFFNLFEKYIMEPQCQEMVEFFPSTIDFFDYFYAQDTIHRQFTQIDFYKLKDEQKDKYTAKLFYYLNLDIEKISSYGNSTTDEEYLIKWAEQQLPKIDLKCVAKMFEKTRSEHNGRAKNIIETLELKHNMQEELWRPEISGKKLKL